MKILHIRRIIRVIQIIIIIHIIFVIHIISSCTRERETIHIPDPGFKAALIANGVDRNLDLDISLAEAGEVDSLDASGFGITDLTGLHHFTNLLYFDCSDNELSQLDVSQNQGLKVLNCGSNHLRQLDVSQNKNLEDLNISGNQLEYLDVSQNTKLVLLSVNSNSIEALDLSNNLKVRELRCLNNPLVELDLTGNPGLIALFCHNNPLRWLDISVNNQMEYLSMEECWELKEICVWELPFPPPGTKILIVNCPNSYFTTDCTHGGE